MTHQPPGFRSADVAVLWAPVHALPEAPLRAEPKQTADDLRRRQAGAVPGYPVRMGAGDAPFGPTAGVAAIGFVDDPADAKVRLGDQHRRAARPSPEWLTGIIRECEQRPEVLAGLRVVFNNTTRPAHEGTAPDPSLPRTAAIRAVAGLADTPILFRDLAAELARAHPAAPPDAVVAVLRQLVAEEVLLTELRPGVATADPLDHVLTVLADAPDGVPDALDAVRTVLTRYAAQPPAESRRALTAVCERMRRLSPVTRPVRLDLALDADIRLPRAVAEEAEHAAELLWRLSPRPPATASLRRYHRDFLDRYGEGTLVAVRDLLDPRTGLGPTGAGFGPPEHDADRDRVLADLVREAASTGAPEVELTDDHVLLTGHAHTEGTRPASLDLHAHLLAESVEALQDGDFRLVVIDAPDQAAATFGRYAHLFDDDTREVFGAVAKAGVMTDPATVVAQLAYPAHGNAVSHAPPWTSNVLPVGSFAELADPAVLRLDDLAVGGDAHGMFVVDAASGLKVAPTTFHPLDPHDAAPEVARFLREVGGVGVRGWRPW
ncbi:MAG: lantibiotic dehydratase family protein, partial [Saccharothrix sp.]|nr:lantibiotic dehydratase family protein [Saccharothrix sp.]